MIKNWTKSMFGEWYGFVAIGFTVATGFSLVGKNIILPLKAWVIFLFLSLLYASFASYRKTFKEYSKSIPEYQIIRKSFSLRNWLGNEETKNVNSVLNVQFSTDVEIRNHSQRPLDIKVVLDSIDSSWSLAKDISETDLEITRSPDSIRQSARAGNLITIEALARTALHIKTCIAFRSSTDTEGINYLEHPGRIIVHLKFEPVGQKSTLKSIECDLSEIHKEVEQGIVTWIRSHQTRNDEEGLQYLKIIKKYWGIQN